MLSTLLDVRTQDTDPLIVRRSRSLALLLLILISISLSLALALFIAGALPGPIISGVASLLFLAVFLINFFFAIPTCVVLLPVELPSLTVCLGFSVRA